MAGVMHANYPFAISYGYHLLVCYTLSSLVFNHLMACIVHPGNIRNLRSDIELLKSKGYYNTHFKNSIIKFKYFKNSEPSLEMKQLMKFRFENLSKLDRIPCDFI